MLGNLYSRLLSYVHHPAASWILGVISFLESSISPIPPDFMLIPMMAEHRERIAWYVWVCTITSVIGGIVGYYIGFSLYDVVGRYLVAQDSLENFQELFAKWGFLVLCIKGFLPIPYKVMAIASGLAKYDLLWFIIASIIARSSRFAVLGLLTWRFGPHVKMYIENNKNRVMLLFIIITIAMIYIGYKVF